jgi:hypothetical protein
MTRRMLGDKYVKRNDVKRGEPPSQLTRGRKDPHWWGMKIIQFNISEIRS